MLTRRAWLPPGPRLVDREVHNAYSGVGLFGLTYPAFHPSQDPSGCFFGHEHGDDPTTSDIPEAHNELFGEQVEAAIVAGERPPGTVEPHNGHKVHVGNNIVQPIGGLTCDIVMNVHQGTAGAGRLTTATHSMRQYLACEGDTQVMVQNFKQLGVPGSYNLSCSRSQVVTITPPDTVIAGRGAARVVPTRDCILAEFVPAGQNSFSGRFQETWQFSGIVNEGKCAGGFCRTIFRSNPYTEVRNAVTYADGVTGNVLSSIGTCFEVLPDGRRLRFSADQAFWCEGAVPGMTQNSLNSPLNGAFRFAQINGHETNNANGPTEWCTDIYGNQAIPGVGDGTCPAGMLLQRIAAITANSQTRGPVNGGKYSLKNHGPPGSGVHAPNE